MGKQHPELRLLPGPTSRATQDDAAVHQMPRRNPLPTLTRIQLDVLLGLLAPGRAKAIPENAERVAAPPLVEFAEVGGLSAPLQRQAAEQRLLTLATEARHAAQRQRFSSRAQLAAAKRASRVLREGSVSPPLLMGSLGLSQLLGAAPAIRVGEPVRFVVPPGELRRASALLTHIPEVSVSARALGPFSRRSLEQSVRLRGCLHAAEGWQLPAPEDCALIEVHRMQTESDAHKLASAVTLLALLDHPSFHWQTFVQRVTIWGMRVCAHRAMTLLYDCLGDPSLAEQASAVAPSPLERIRHRLLGS